MNKIEHELIKELIFKEKDTPIEILIEKWIFQYSIRVEELIREWKNFEKIKKEIYIK